MKTLKTTHLYQCVKFCIKFAHTHRHTHKKINFLALSLLVANGITVS